MATLALRDTFASRGKWLTVLFVLLLGLLSANSRGAFIALAVGLVAWDVYCRRYGRLAIKLVGAGAIYLLALTAAQFSAYFAALVGKDSGADSTADYRVQLLRRGMEEIHKHPILGQNMKAALELAGSAPRRRHHRSGQRLYQLWIDARLYGHRRAVDGVRQPLPGDADGTRKLRLNPALLEPAACVFAAAALSIPNSFFTGFGSEASTTFYELCALGSALWAMRKLAPSQRMERDNPMRPPPTGIAALIAADRARAAQARSNAALPAPAGG